MLFGCIYKQMHMQSIKYVLPTNWFGCPPKTQNVLNLPQDTIPFAMSQGFSFQFWDVTRLTNPPQEDLTKFDYKTNMKIK
jgi:hypothetical protein